MGPILSLGCLKGVPSLDCTEPADAAADRALAESSRHALDVANGGRLGIPHRPTRADVANLAKRAAKRLKSPFVLPGVFTPVPAVSFLC